MNLGLTSTEVDFLSDLLNFASVPRRTGMKYSMVIDAAVRGFQGPHVMFGLFETIFFIHKTQILLCFMFEKCVANEMGSLVMNYAGLAFWNLGGLMSGLINEEILVHGSIIER